MSEYVREFFISLSKIQKLIHQEKAIIFLATNQIFLNRNYY